MPAVRAVSYARVSLPRPVLSRCWSWHVRVRHLLLPWAMLSMPLFGEIPATFLALAVVQIPLYGVILDLAGK